MRIYRKIKPDLRSLVKLPHETDEEFTRHLIWVKIVDLALCICFLFLIYAVTQI